MSRNSDSHPLCVGKCKEFEVLRSGLERRYKPGHKRCQQCNQWMLYEGVFCPCCNYRLRTRPRCKKYKVDLPRI
ncbi:hypothetical protein [Nitrosopumilus sp.]|uniref:hypothetical protein n=1 Tax=Nitrosopumilus sp. TaxID=2024843 RepID=UPI00247E4BA9|nr:hypothetical protein [Nitrosopumilus sp.]MCV0410183.1 hypothetical protein [Nitrosopumilus sp.]